MASEEKPAPAAGSSAGAGRGGAAPAARGGAARAARLAPLAAAALAVTLTLYAAYRPGRAPAELRAAMRRAAPALGRAAEAARGGRWPDAAEAARELRGIFDGLGAPPRLGHFGRARLALFAEGALAPLSRAIAAEDAAAAAAAIALAAGACNDCHRASGAGEIRVRAAPTADATLEE
jgi:hypothetical protein